MASRKQSLQPFHIVFIAAEDEHKSEQTLPLIAREAEQLGARTTVLTAYPDPSNPSDIPGLEALNTADLTVFFIRFRALPEEQLRYIQNYIESGRPVIGLRTSTHGFRYPEGHPLELWNTKFGTDVLGAPWILHYGHTSSTDVTADPGNGQKRHPILEGVPERFHVRSWLYYVLPYPPAGSDILLWGRPVNAEALQVPETVNPLAWIFRNYGGGHTFTTTMGHPDDFLNPAFLKLLKNAIHWLLGVSPQGDSWAEAVPEATGKPSNWIPLTSIEEMAQTDYDVLIIGSGAGGGASLWRLCEQSGASDAKIGMIEAGPLLLPSHGRNIPTLNQERFIRFFENPRHTDYIGKYWPDYSAGKIIRALGGRTLQWYLMSPRLTAAQFEAWPIPYKEITSYYLIAEEIMNVNTGYAKGSSIQQTLLERLRSNGFPDAQALPLAVDLDATQLGVVHSNVFFSSINFLAYAMNIRPFDLAVNTRAVQVLTEGGRAAGIKVMTSDKKTYDIRAKTIIVSAGTWETPRLLLNSGIPGRAIGHYLVNHPKVFANAKTGRSQFSEVSGIASLMIPNPDNNRLLITGIGTDPENYYWYAYETKNLLDELTFRFFGPGTMEARFENRVYLLPGIQDEYGVPRLQVDFSYSNQDRTMITEMFKFMRNAVAAMGLEFVAEPRLLVPGEDNHETGTCRMGLDPDTSATNLYGQIHGIPNLFVADNSVVRLTGPANPTLTTIALAIRTADYLIAQLKAPE